MHAFISSKIRGKEGRGYYLFYDSATPSLLLRYSRKMVAAQEGGEEHSAAEYVCTQAYMYRSQRRLVPLVSPLGAHYSMQIRTKGSAFMVQEISLYARATFIVDPYNWMHRDSDGTPVHLTKCIGSASHRSARWFRAALDAGVAVC